MRMMTGRTFEIVRGAVLLVVLVTAIPCIGWLAGLAAVLFGLGAFWMGVRGLKSPETTITPAA